MFVTDSRAKYALSMFSKIWVNLSFDVLIKKAVLIKKKKSA